jgi:oxygen-independent coproporphyrinogen-3 oxidase
MEMELRVEHKFIENEKLESIYFGGGTPSFIDPEWILRFIQLSNELFSVEPDAEITLEANPEDVTPKNLIGWKQAGINRLSIGVQSLDAEDLKFMNRNHTAAQAKKSIALALAHGFDNLNLDLIFGSPWLSTTNWEQTLNWAFNSGVSHISAYGLTVEPKTFLNKKIEEGTWPKISDSRQEEQYLLLDNLATAWGWDFYEISNLCKPGRRAKHNSNYWKNLPYLGIGPSAHSYNQNVRRWNIADNKKYTETIAADKAAYESEILNANDIFNEYLLTNIRTVEGISKLKLGALAGNFANELKEKATQFIADNLITENETHWQLTIRGKLLSDWITREWML